MATVPEIKQAIDRLSFQERFELMILLNPPEADDWDRQMQRDSEQGGKLDRLTEKARKDSQAGECVEWPLHEIPRSS